MALTKDAISGGELFLYQTSDGYRFGLDAVLLATDLPDISGKHTIVDLGAGNGAVGLMVAARNENANVIFVERQPSLFDLIEKNIALNFLQDQADARLLDIRDHRKNLPPQSAELVLCNPPYYKPGQGKRNNSPEKAAAHHELHGTLKDFIQVGQYVAKPKGKMKLVLPPFRLPELIAIINPTDFGLRSLRFIHSRESEDAYLMEVWLQRGTVSNCKVVPALILHEGPSFRKEVRRRFDYAAKS